MAGRGLQDEAVMLLLQREEDPITVFMGVPTMYSYLLSHYASMAPREQAAARKAAARLRLTVSGSAACPLPVIHQWQELSGQLLFSTVHTWLGLPYCHSRCREGDKAFFRDMVDILMAGAICEQLQS